MVIIVVIMMMQGEKEMKKQATETYVYPTYDGYVDAKAPSVDYNTASALKVAYSSGDMQRWFASYLQFVIPDIEIGFAYLELYVSDTPSLAPGYVEIVDFPGYIWAEESFNYNTRPIDEGLLSTSYYYSGFSSQWTDVDLTDFIKIHKGETITIGILPIEGDDAWFWFDSIDFLEFYKPRLHIIGMPNYQDFLSYKNTYLLDGSLLDFVSNANQWVI